MSKRIICVSPWVRSPAWTIKVLSLWNIELDVLEKTIWQIGLMGSKVLRRSEERTLKNQKKKKKTHIGDEQSPVRNEIAIFISIAHP